MTLFYYKNPIILASSSIIRKKILQNVGIDCQAINPDFDEEEFKLKNYDFTIKKMAINLAINKAKSISKNYSNHIIIGCDQICEIDGKILNKSNNLNEAENQIRILNNKTHYQNNATIAILNNKIIFKKFLRVKLKMRQLIEDEIKKYIILDNSFGSSGSYKYESFAMHLFSNVKGDYHSILGINLQDLLSFLHKKKYIKFI